MGDLQAFTLNLKAMLFVLWASCSAWGSAKCTRKTKELVTSASNVSLCGGVDLLFAAAVSGVQTCVGTVQWSSGLWWLYRRLDGSRGRGCGQFLDMFAQRTAQEGRTADTPPPAPKHIIHLPELHSNHCSIVMCNDMDTKYIIAVSSFPFLVSSTCGWDLIPFIFWSCDKEVMHHNVENYLTDLLTDLMQRYTVTRYVYYLLLEHLRPLCCQLYPAYTWWPDQRPVCTNPITVCSWEKWEIKLMKLAPGALSCSSLCDSDKDFTPTECHWSGPQWNLTW